MFRPSITFLEEGYCFAYAEKLKLDVRMKTDTLQICPATPDRLQDFLHFFDEIAFKDNPDWSGCYCQCYFIDHKKIKWSERTKTENRTDAVKQVANGNCSGLLAYQDGRPVAWCNMGNKKELQPIRDAHPEKSSAQNVASLFCFLVAKDFRGKGFARQLLEAACEHLTTQSFNVIEAYPDTKTESDADKFHGSLKMFLEAGFEIHEPANAKGRVVVRKPVNKPS